MESEGTRNRRGPGGSRRKSQGHPIRDPKKIGLRPIFCGSQLDFPLRRRGKEKRDRGPRGRFSTGDERFLRFRWKEKFSIFPSFALFPCVFLSDRRWLCRKWHAIFGKAISARLSTCFFPLPLRGRGKKSSPKARPRESIRSPENCIQFSGDKSEIRAAGGLRKGEKRSVKKSQKGARNGRKTRFSHGIRDSERFYSLCPAGAEEKNTRIGRKGMRKILPSPNL